MDQYWPHCVNHLREAFTGQGGMTSKVIKVTEFKFDVSFDVRGHLEAAMASEATKMAVRGNMQMDTRVIEVPDFNSEVKFERPVRPLRAPDGLRGHFNGCYGGTFKSRA